MLRGCVSEQAADALSPGASCAGQAYFITNADPQPFWQFLGDFLEPLGYDRPSKRLPWQLIFLIAVIVEFIIRLLKPIKVGAVQETAGQQPHDSTRPLGIVDRASWEGLPRIGV
jgi:hypothetical protein